MPTTSKPLNVLVLAGGPDRAHDVSLMSGREIANALEQAGHTVRTRDIRPEDLSALEAFRDWPGDVIFPALHGKWGEGGGLQHLLDERGLCYVGTGGAAAELCMDKRRAKLALEADGLPTPEFAVVNVGEPCPLEPPVVVKPIDEGSSIDLTICRTAEAINEARQRSRDRHRHLMVERFVAGKELTVGILGGFPDGERALPPIQIVPAGEWYDYEAKYTRSDTRYLFAPDIDLPEWVLDECERIAMAAHKELGARHLSRVDFIVDDRNQPWVLELNTLPGFTTHSLLPMAARRAGLELPQLVDQLVRLAAEGR